MFSYVKNKKVVLWVLLWASTSWELGGNVLAENRGNEVQIERRSTLPWHVKKVLEKKSDKFGSVMQYYAYHASWSLAMIKTLVYLALLSCPSIAVFLRVCLGYSKKLVGDNFEWYVKETKIVNDCYVRLGVGIVCCVLACIGLALSYYEYRKVVRPGAFVLTKYGFLVARPASGLIWTPYDEIVMLEERQQRMATYKSFRLKDRDDHVYEYGLRDMVYEKEWEELYQGIKKKVEARGLKVKVTVVK